jgi:hypothetical protein
LRKIDHLPSLFREGIYDDSAANIQTFIFILNPTDNPKIFQDAYDTVKQKYQPGYIYEVPMSKNNANVESLEDLWSKHIDLDE